MICKLKLHLSHKSLVGLTPLQLLLVVLAVEYFLVDDFFDDLLPLLILQYFANLVLL